MPSWLLILIVLAVVVGVIAIVHKNAKPKRMSDERLVFFRSFLWKPSKKNGDTPKRSSKPFRTTTAPLSKEDEAEIKTIFTPQMLAEFEEGYTHLFHRLALRAIDLEQVLRRQAALLPDQKLTADEEAVLISEGLREQSSEPEVLILNLKPEPSPKSTEHIKFPYEERQQYD